MAASVHLVHPDTGPVLSGTYKGRLEENKRLIGRPRSRSDEYRVGRRILNDAAREGDIATCEWTLQKVQVTKTDIAVAFEFAALAGQKKVMEWFFYHTVHIKWRTIEKGFIGAAEEGHFDCCLWCIDNTLVIDKGMILKANRNALLRGQKNLESWLEQRLRAVRDDTIRRGNGAAAAEQPKPQKRSPSLKDIFSAYWK